MAFFEDKPHSLYLQASFWQILYDSQIIENRDFLLSILAKLFFH